MIFHNKVMDFSIRDFLNSKIQEAASALPELGEDFDPEIRLSEANFGDFQSNGVLSYCGKKKLNPRATAQSLCENFAQQHTNEYTIECAGPGFLNLTIKDGALIQWLLQFHTPDAYDGHLRSIFSGQTVVIDYSSPNTAKRMHVGHLRSMVIGEALQRFVSFSGGKVIRDNHLGDWGTQFGILLREIKRTGYVFNESPTEAIEHLEHLYQIGVKATKDDSKALDEAHKELLKLQQGDTENKALWKRINDISYQSFNAIYQRMGVTFDYVLGESFYYDKVDAVYQALQQYKLAAINQGALVVFHPEHPRFCKQPFIIRKSDGASNYASTDLATVKYRTDQLKADAIIYVTDARQCDHFEQLFFTIKKWFACENKPIPGLYHAYFGMVLDNTGKAIKTRDGKPIQLHTLLDEAVTRAYDLICTKSPDLSEEEKRHVAEVVGCGSIKYADLSQDRTSNYRFDFDKMIRFEGNTAPYLLYAVARIHAIFRKLNLNETNCTVSQVPGHFSTETERSLAHKLIAFPTILSMAIKELKPHYLCRYLFELAGCFSTFYNADKVMTDDQISQNLRLLLCKATLSTLKKGLYLLGLETVERM